MKTILSILPLVICQTALAASAPIARFTFSTTPPETNSLGVVSQPALSNRPSAGNTSATLRPGTNYLASARLANPLYPNYAEGAPSVIIVATDPEATRGPTPDNGEFKITRDGDLSLPLTVQFSIGGTALAGSAYQTLTAASVIIPPNSASTVIAVAPSVQSGSVHEASVTLTLQPDEQGSYNVGLPETAVVSIYDPSVAPPNPAPVPSGLVAWWPGESNPWDANGGGKATPVSSLAYSRCEVGQGFSIEGSGSGAWIGPAPALDLQNFTIEAWIRRGDSNFVCWDTWAEALIFGGAWGGYGFGLANDGRLLLSKIGDSGVYSTSAITDTDSFHHVAVTKSGSTVIFFLDGTPETSDAYDPGFLTGGSYAVGACADYCWNDFFGKVDDLAVYNRALSQNEIQAIHAAAWSGKCLAPVIFEQPQPLAVAAGDPATFNVAVAGTPELAFQWRLNGASLVPQTNSSLTLPAAQVGDAGQYSVTVANSLGTATSSDALLTVSPPPPCAAALAGLVAWWAAENNALDWAGTNHGTLVGGVGFAPGRVGAAFTTTNDYSGVGIGHPDGFQVQDFTIEAWIKRADPSLVSFSYGEDSLFLSCGLYGYGFGLASSGQPFLSKIGLDAVTPDITVSDTAWHHVALTKSGTTVIFYVDGTAYPTDPYGSTFDLGSDLSIGARGGDFWNAFNGLIDELSFYSRPLADTEIQAIYAAGRTGKCQDTDGSGMPSWWQLKYFGQHADPNADADGDGLSNYLEYFHGTNPTAKDTDGDGLTDLEELSIPLDASNLALGYLDPTKSDTGNTGVPDGEKDSDHDGLSNLAELREYGSDPITAHTFDATVADAEYFFEASSEGRNTRTRVDITESGGVLTFTLSGLLAGDCYDVYYSPVLAAPHGWWRRIYSTAPGQTSFQLVEPVSGVTAANFRTLYARDKDGDGLSSGYEEFLGLAFANPDSDADGLLDGWEFQYGLDPLSAAGDNGPNGNPDGDRDGQPVDHDGRSLGQPYSNKREHDWFYASPVPHDAAYDPLKNYLDDRPRPVLYITPGNATAVEGGAPGTFTITRAVGYHAIPNTALRVYYAIGGTAASYGLVGADYTFNPAPIAANLPRIYSVDIPAGQSNVTVTVTPTDDHIAEGMETLIVTLTPFSTTGDAQPSAPGTWNYVVDVQHDRAVLRILDQEAPQMVVAIHDSDKTRENWHSAATFPYFVLPESVKEALRSDGTPFVVLNDEDIASGRLMIGDPLAGTPRYPIFISLGAENISSDNAGKLRAYVNKGGFLFVGSSAFTRDENGGTPGDFALAAEMGLHCAPGADWATRSDLQKNADHRLVSHIPSDAHPWLMPSKPDEITWGKANGNCTTRGGPPAQSHQLWPVSPDSVSPATVLLYGTTPSPATPYLTVRQSGAGFIIYDAAFEPLIAHGGYAPGMYAYMIFRNAIEWAFESGHRPIAKVSPWPFSYDAAFTIRHDFENWVGLMPDQEHDHALHISESAAAERANLDGKGRSAPAWGDYYFSTGAALDLQPAPFGNFIAGLHAAVALGATVAPHNGGSANPDCPGQPTTRYDYYHWGTDEAVSPTGDYTISRESLRIAFQDHIETWLNGYQNPVPRIWCSPYFNATREESFDLQKDLNIKIAGEQKLTPFPHWTLATRNETATGRAGPHYSILSEPTSEWLIDGHMAQSLDDFGAGTGNLPHNFATMRNGVDFYYGIGALINFYSHARSDDASVVSDYIKYTLDPDIHSNVWSTNARGIYQWWLVRSNVHIATTYSVNGLITTAAITVAGAQHANTAVEVLVPDAGGFANLLVSRNGTPAPDDTFRQKGNLIKVLVGTIVTDVQVQYTALPNALEDTYTATAGTPLVVSAANGVLKNDTTPRGGTALTATKVDGQTGLNLDASGSFTYTWPYPGQYSFRYTASDGQASSAPATVTVLVGAAANGLLDTFDRTSDPAPLSPWVAQSGSWSISGGKLVGGPQSGYNIAYYPGSWASSVEGRIKFEPGAFGGAIGGRLYVNDANPLDQQNGSRYEAWIYPDESHGPFAANMLALVKFDAWEHWTQLSHVSLGSVGTGWHSLKMEFKPVDGQPNLLLINVYYDSSSLPSTYYIDGKPGDTPILAPGGVSFDTYSGVWQDFTATSFDNTIAVP